MPGALVGDKAKLLAWSSRSKSTPPSVLRAVSLTFTAVCAAPGTFRHYKRDQKGLKEPKEGVGLNTARETLALFDAML